MYTSLNMYTVESVKLCERERGGERGREREREREREGEKLVLKVLILALQPYLRVEAV